VNSCRVHSFRCPCLLSVIYTLSIPFALGFPRRSALQALSESCRQAGCESKGYPRQSAASGTAWSELFLVGEFDVAIVIIGSGIRSNGETIQNRGEQRGAQVFGILIVRGEFNHIVDA